MASADKWDQLEHGRDFDFSRGFFEQFAELQLVSPRASLFITRGTIENSPYTNTVTNMKNCYLVFSGFDSEYSYYTNMIRKCSNVCDCTEIYNSDQSNQTIR